MKSNKHTLNRKRAASCLWAYHDAKHAAKDFIRLQMYEQAADARSTMVDARVQYEQYKHTK